MILRSVPAVVGLSLVATLVACSEHGASDPTSESTEGRVGTGRDLLEARALQIAADYREWHSVYVDPHWAPTMCAAPSPHAIESRAKDGSAHARKLYFLFTNHLNNYLGLSDSDADNSHFADDFALVKESWTHKLVEGSPPVEEDVASPLPAGEAGSATVAVPDERYALFLMFRVEPGPLDSDDGWIYATTTADGSEVIEVGKIASCMGCHAKAPHGRLFGPIADAQSSQALGGADAN